MYEALVLRDSSCSVIVSTHVAAQEVAAKAGPADLDSDGKVSRQEFFEMRAKFDEKAGKKSDPAVTEKQFTARDVNGDGFLTGEEAVPKK